MPPTPWSPMPRMPSESVATSRSTSSGPEAVVAQGRLDVLRVVDRQVDPARAPVLVAEPFDRPADGRGVDDREHLLDVLGEQPVEQDLVAVAQVGQVDVPGQVVGLALVLGVDPPQLAVDGGHPAGSSPVSPSASRSSRVNAVPRLSIGVVSTSVPRARIGRVPVLGADQLVRPRRACRLLWGSGCGGLMSRVRPVGRCVQAGRTDGGSGVSGRAGPRRFVPPGGGTGCSASGGGSVSSIMVASSNGSSPRSTSWPAPGRTRRPTCR